MPLRVRALERKMFDDIRHFRYIKQLSALRPAPRPLLEMLVWFAECVCANLVVEVWGVFCRPSRPPFCLFLGGGGEGGELGRFP